MSAVLEPFIRSPKLPLYVAELNQLLAAEQAARERFRNDFEPDIVFYRAEKAAAFRREEIIFPPPDLVVEVLAETTEARDRGVKMEDYAAHGVREYWLVDPDREFIEQYDLQGERYALRAKQADGTLQSRIVPGFAVPVRAVFDRALNLEILGQAATAESAPPR
jgi:Uma2 family endonuclease